MIGSMLRAIGLTMQNEARLLFRDPVVLLMLVLAPVVIILVAGYSLGSLYGGGAGAFRIPVVDNDHGEVATGIIDALRHEPKLQIDNVKSVDEARRIVTREDRAPLAIEIPAGTSAGVARGRHPCLILFVDPVKRIEVDALEVRLARLCRQVTERAQARAQARLSASATELRGKIQSLAAQVREEQDAARAHIKREQAAALASIRAQTAAAFEQTKAQVEATVAMRERTARANLERQLASRQAVLEEVERYLNALEASQHSFEDWLAELKQKAGSHAADIPAPPTFPAPPPAADLAELAKPIAIPTPAAALDLPTPRAIAIEPLKPPQIRDSISTAEIERLASGAAPTLPGGLGLEERSAGSSSKRVVNAFDQYVPGFGVTFLLIAMLMGVSLTLFDEREWGTLERLRVSGAPLSGVLLGKLIARFLIGTIQMVVLFAIGWALFGISLGPSPLALLLPSAAISFAAASFGLVITAVSRTHDAVMPLGTMIAMAMSAIGGCWWPLDFEPAWMRALARWLPTTWTMQAYNDLMIRNLPTSAALWPFLITIALGALYLAAGMFGMLRLED